MQNKVILFDIDYTLFDTEKYRNTIFSALEAEGLSEEILIKTYAHLRSFGSFDPILFTQMILKFLPQKTEKETERLEGLWWNDTLLASCIYPETQRVLERLAEQKNLTVGIFSAGQSGLQKRKVQALEHLFNQDHIHIFDFKEENLSQVLSEHSKEVIYLVDDLIDILQDASKFNKEIVTIWMKRGQFADHTELPDDYRPSHIIENLNYLIPIIVPPSNLTT